MARTDRHVLSGLRYAQDVVGGRLPASSWTRLACERELADQEREGTGGFAYRFDEDRASRVCRFIEHLKHIKGPLAGSNIKLEPWQCWVICTVFGWVHVGGLRANKRRFRRVYVEVPRGNAKSTLSSGIGLYMLAADKEGGAEVYSAATTRDQARIVFRDAQQMARKAPELMRPLGVDVAAHNINVLRSASKFEALSAEGETLDGLNIHLAVVDELHAHKTREVYDVIETGTGKRDQSLLWCITTAGTNLSGICFEVRTYLTKVLQGVAQDDAFFGCIWSIDDGDDWTDEEACRKANPNWGVSVMPDVVAGLRAKALQMPAAQNNFKTKHLNVWCQTDTAWMDMRAWQRMADPALSIEDFRGQRCLIGLDLASKTDVAAKVYLFPRDLDGQRHFYVFGRYYLPEAAVSDGRNSQYAGWEIDGRLVTTPGDVLDFSALEGELIDDSSAFQVVRIAYDPWQATQLAQGLQAQGAAVIEYRNTVANFSSPMKEIDALVRSGRLHHDGCPVLTWMVSNVVCHVDAKENIYPRKQRPENKIDGVVALISALGCAMAEPALKRSVYEERGLLTV